MMLLIGEFNQQFGFDQRRRLTNPDVYRITIGTKVKIQRIGQGE